MRPHAFGLLVGGLAIAVPMTGCLVFRVAAAPRPNGSANTRGADFNGDGSKYADLAIGNPGDHYHEAYEHGSGTVQVLYGSADGLTADGSQRWSAAMPSLVARGHVHGFPETMASGDFDADGRDDLALASIGGPRADTAGSITVLYGSPAGLTAARAQTWSQDSVGIAGVPEASEWFGRGLAAGSFGLDSGGSDLGGALTVLYGADGPTSKASRRWTPLDFGLSASGFGYFPEDFTS